MMLSARSTWIRGGSRRDSVLLGADVSGRASATGGGVGASGVVVELEPGARRVLANLLSDSIFVFVCDDMHDAEPKLDRRGSEEI